jgi:hypothetical protein
MISMFIVVTGSLHVHISVVTKLVNYYYFSRLNLT